MDDALVERAQFVVDKLTTVPETARLLIAIAGVPASGKTTFATRLVERVNVLLAHAQQKALLVSLDGWHLTRAQLDAMDDPQHAHDRRGSHWTFDADAYLAFVARLRAPLSSTPSDNTSSHVLYAPAFDHALKDPTPDAVAIRLCHRIVIVEGLYSMLDVEPWREAAAQMDERWWIQIDTARARTRLVARHVQTGVAKDVDEAIWRAENNDEDNGRFIAKNLFNVTYTIESVDDPGYTT